MTAFGQSRPLRGTARIPGDKSISHRALMVAALAVGESRIQDLGEGEDIAATVAALRALGAEIDAQNGLILVQGVGTGGLIEPRDALDLGNSGTSARLLTGLIASHPISACLIGDRSLSRRPMERVAAPLRRMGARVDTKDGGLPVMIRGAAPPLPRRHRLEVASAQVKSAVLLAALNTPGWTEVEAPPSRDHIERMLPIFGVQIERAENGMIRVRGETELHPARLTIPGDPSAAAFLAVAALIVPGSHLRIENVGVNPGRIGLFEMLQAMGGDLRFTDPREYGSEPVADLEVRHSPLCAIEVPLNVASRMIDEFPIFFIAAAFASGRSRATGLSELRVKESDRLSAMSAGLRACGVRVEETIDGLVVEGRGGDPIPGGALVQSFFDHRVAMSFAVAGLHCVQPIGLDDMGPIKTSFPRFLSVIEALIEP